MVARSQTVEDGPPRMGVYITLHGAGTPQEFIRLEVPVRVNRIWRRMVIRASQVTEQITASIETLRLE